MGNKISCLLIGGHHDGEWHEFDLNQYELRFPYFPEIEGERIARVSDEEEHPKEGKCHVEIYRLHKIACGSKVFYYLARKELSEEETIQLLLKRYKH